jgi:hypothetical protein
MTLLTEYIPPARRDLRLYHCGLGPSHPKDDNANGQEQLGANGNRDLCRRLGPIGHLLDAIYSGIDIR